MAIHHNTDGNTKIYRDRFGSSSPKQQLPFHGGYNESSTENGKRYRHLSQNIAYNFLLTHLPLTPITLRWDYRDSTSVQLTRADSALCRPMDGDRFHDESLDPLMLTFRRVLLPLASM